MPDPMVVGRVTDLSRGRVTIDPYLTPKPSNWGRIAKLIVAAREFGAVKAQSRDKVLVAIAADKVLAAALDID